MVWKDSKAVIMQLIKNVKVFLINLYNIFISEIR